MMRNVTKFASPVAAALLFVGCGSGTPSNSDADAKLLNAKEKITEAARATADAARAQREKYVSEAKQELHDLNLKCEELADRAAQSEGQARRDLEKRLEGARSIRDAAAKKLDELEKSGVEGWEKVRDEVQKALDDLKKSL